LCTGIKMVKTYRNRTLHFTPNKSLDSSLFVCLLCSLWLNCQQGNLCLRNSCHNACDLRSLLLHHGRATNSPSHTSLGVDNRTSDWHHGQLLSQQVLKGSIHRLKVWHRVLLQRDLQFA
jgi:hypothetical protein